MGGVYETDVTANLLVCCFVISQDVDWRFPGGVGGDLGRG